MNPPLNFGQRLGIAFIVESASFSAAAVTILLIYIGYRALRAAHTRSPKCPKAQKPSDLCHIQHYFLNLMVSELIRSIGAIMSIKWVADAAVTEGPLCTAQAIFKQAGETGMALTSFTIAAHTFCVLVFRWKFHRATAIIVIAVMWTLIVLAIGLSIASHKGKDYYGAYWCRINQDNLAFRLVFQDLLWVVAVLNTVIYAFLASVLYGIIVVDHGGVRVRKWTWRNRVKDEMDSECADEERRQSNTIAVQMLLYPAVNIVYVFPLAVTRMAQFSGRPVPYTAIMFSNIIYSLSGVLNVVLFTLTRPKLLWNCGDEDSSSDPPMPLCDDRWGSGLQQDFGNFPVNPTRSPSGQVMRQSSDDAPGYMPDHGMRRLPDYDLRTRRVDEMGQLPVHDPTTITPPITIMISSH